MAWRLSDESILKHRESQVVSNDADKSENCLGGRPWWLNKSSISGVMEEIWWLGQ